MAGGTLSRDRGLAVALGGGAGLGREGVEHDERGRRRDLDGDERERCERDAAGVYEPTNGSSTSDCTGRPASRLACIMDEHQERTDEIVEDLEQIEIPDIEVPEITVPTMPPLPAC
jgi:hypothetical protein